MCLSCILQLCELGSFEIFCRLLGILSVERQSCHLRIGAILFLCNSYALYFLSLLHCTAWDCQHSAANSAESAHPCLVPDIGGKSFDSPSLIIMLAVSLSMLFIKLRKLHSFFLRVFFLTQVFIEFCQMLFSTLVDMIMVFFFFC